MSIIDSLKEELDLEGNDSEIRRAFKEKIKEVHPDRNGGEFKNEEEKTLYIKLDKAIKELNGNQLPVITSSDIVALVESISLNNKKVDLNEDLVKKTEKSYLRYQSKHLFPKISITAISTIISIIWLFPSQVSDHPILGQYINFEGLGFSLIWIYSLLSAVYCWVWLNLRERKQKAFLSDLNTEAYQNSLFYRFIDNINEVESFTKYDFIYSLMHGDSRYARYSLSSASINQIADLEVAQSIADIVFLRAEDKGLIKKIYTKSLMDEYTLN